MENPKRIKDAKLPVKVIFSGRSESEVLNEDSVLLPSNHHFFSSSIVMIPLHPSYNTYYFGEFTMSRVPHI